MIMSNASFSISDAELLDSATTVLNSSLVTFW